MKRGVGKPNSQMGKSYANSALLRANQCRPSALPRDWLAPRKEGPERPGIPALPIQVHARSLVYTRASLPHSPAPSSRSAPFQGNKHARACVRWADGPCTFGHPVLSPLPDAVRQTRATGEEKLKAAAKAKVVPNRNENNPRE